MAVLALQERPHLHPLCSLGQVTVFVGDVNYSDYLIPSTTDHQPIMSAQWSRVVYVWALVMLASPTAAVDGTDFSNNLFTDLAPLLALFGEQVS